MDQVLGVLFYVLMFGGAVAGYSSAVARDASRIDVMLAAALGSAIPALVLVATAPSAALHSPLHPVGLPNLVAGLVLYVLLSAASGACIALCGLAARALGAWLTRWP